MIPQPTHPKTFLSHSSSTAGAWGFHRVRFHIFKKRSSILCSGSELGFSSSYAGKTSGMPCSSHSR